MKILFTLLLVVTFLSSCATEPFYQQLSWQVPDGDGVYTFEDKDVKCYIYYEDENTQMECLKKSK